MSDSDSRSTLDRLLMELVDGKLTLDLQQQLWDMLRDDPGPASDTPTICCSTLTSPGSTRGKRANRRQASAGRVNVSLWRSERNGGYSGQENAANNPGAGLATACLLVVCLSLVGAAIGWWPRQGPTPRAIMTSANVPDRWDETADESKSGGVAILTREVDVVWEEGVPAVAIGSTISQGVLRIRSGVLQLEFLGGATVVAEGPAEIELKAIDRIACRSGKLRVQVSPSARGFRVESPTFDLVDLGTEFGMRVVPDQRSEVHVFDGKVELYETDRQSGRAAKWELDGGSRDAHWQCRRSDPARL